MNIFDFDLDDPESLEELNQCLGYTKKGEKYTSTYRYCGLCGHLEWFGAHPQEDGEPGAEFVIRGGPDDMSDDRVHSSSGDVREAHCGYDRGH